MEPATLNPNTSYSLNAGARAAARVQHSKPQGGAGRDVSVQLLLAELEACCRSRDLQAAKRLHAEAVESGQASDIYVASSLVNSYAKCGSMAEAHQMFDSIEHPDVVSWTALIQGYVDNGQSAAALDLFTRMTRADPAPNSRTIVSALKACISLAVSRGASECRHCGKALHRLSAETGCSSDNHVQNTLIDMYGKCQSLADARQVFDRMADPDVVSWTALISGHAENGEGLTALDLFSRMVSEGPAPNAVTFVSALRACASLAASSSGVCSQRGKGLHRLAVDSGCSSDVYVQNTLIDMYSKCGIMSCARQVFVRMSHKNVISCTAMMLGYAENGKGSTALDIFAVMNSRGPAPNSVTFVAALKACATLTSTQGRHRGKAVHKLAAQEGCSSSIHVQSSLIDMYSKCGSMIEARRVFDILKRPDVVSWTALILGYADNGQCLAALELYRRMRIEGPAPNSITFGAALKACAVLGALEFGRSVHSEIDMRSANVALVTSLVDFYAKCGSLVEAQTVFDLHAERRDVITWNALLAGFSSCGDEKSVFELFQRMQDSSYCPDAITFLCILTCCSHAGLVDRAKEYFDAMPTKYGIVRRVEHYNCMIDTLGRANKLDDAVTLLRGMPCSPNYVTWMTVLSACRKWKNAEIGRLAFESLIDLDHRDAAAYVLMGQIYGSRGMVQEQEMVMGMRGKISAWKAPAEACWTDGVGNSYEP